MLEAYCVPRRRARDRGARDHGPRRLRPDHAGLRLRLVRGPRAGRPRGRRPLGRSWPGHPVRGGGHVRARATRTTSAAGSAATRTTTSSAASTSARSPRTRRPTWPSFAAGRPLAEIVAPYFDEVIGAARSGLFDTIGHLDFVKRYLVPHVHAGAARRRARAVRARARRARREPARPWRSTRPACASCPRETYPSAAIVARYRELGGRHVTIGSDAHRTEWFAYGLGKAYRQAAERRVRGAGVPARRRPGRRSPCREDRDQRPGLTRGRADRYDDRRRGDRPPRGGGTTG